MFSKKKKKSSISSISSSEGSFKQTKKITNVKDKNGVLDLNSRLQNSQNHDLWHTKLFKDVVSSSSESDTEEEDSFNKIQKYSKDEFRGKITFDFEVSREKYKKNKQFVPKKTSSANTDFPKINNINIIENGTNIDKSCKTDRINLYPKAILQNPTVPTIETSGCDPKIVSTATTRKSGERINISKKLKGQVAMLVCYDFVAVEPTDISVSMGQRVQVVNKSDNNWWWIRTPNGREGYVPRNFLVDIPVIPFRTLTRSKSITFGENHKVAKDDCLETNYKYIKAKTVKIAPMAHVQVNELSEKHLHINKLKEEYREARNGDSLTGKDFEYLEYKMDCTSTIERLKLERRRSFSGRQKKVRFLEDAVLNKRYSDVCTSTFGQFVECATWC